MSSAAEKSAPDRFVETFLQEEIEAVLNGEKPAIEASWRDLYTVDTDYAEDALVYPESVVGEIEDAVADYVDADASGSAFTVWLVDLGDEHVYSPGELRADLEENYVGIRGDLSRVTVPKETAEELAYVCVRCETITRVPTTGGASEPHECATCERQGPFRQSDEHTDWKDVSRLRIETPPGEAAKSGGEHIDGHASGAIVDHGSEVGLYGRAGDRVVAYGKLNRVMEDDGSDDGVPIWDVSIEVEAIEFVHDDGEVDIKAHREEFERLAAREDAPELFAESLAPELYTTDEWDAALRLAVPYLFKAPRVSPDVGPTYRGDLNMLIVSDYGMGKSLFLSSVRDFSPDAIKKSTTGLSSDVGLTAAAVKDDFGAGQWAIRPGLLVRASGGHLLLDELDKTDADLTKMNDALEGEQVVDVEKAGQSATYQSQTGLLAAANPEEGRFSRELAIAPQIGIRQSLLNRFDGIVTMEDSVDEEQDAKIAERQVLSYAEAAEADHADREEFDVLERPVSPEVGRAWIKHAWENVHPTGIDEYVDEIKEWYASEARRLNEQFAAGEGAGEDMPVPVNARVVMAVIRMSVAFARVHLREEVQAEDVERAKDLAKQLISQNWDGEKFNASREFEAGNASQRDRVQSIKSLVDELSEDYGGAVPEAAVIEEAEEIGISADKAEKEVEQLKQKGELYEPPGEKGVKTA